MSNFPKNNEFQLYDRGDMLATIVPLLNDIIAAIGGGGGGGATSANQLVEIARLEQIRDKIIAAPSTEAKQDVIVTSLADILAALANKATAANQALTNGKLDTLNENVGLLLVKDFATQTTLAAVLAKIIAAPATSALQTTGNNTLTNIFNNGTTANGSLANVVSELEAANTSLTSLDAKDFSTEATLETCRLRLVEILSSVQSINTRVNQLAEQNTLNDIKTIQLSIDSRLSDLNNKTTDVKTKLDSIIAQLDPVVASGSFTVTDTNSNTLTLNDRARRLYLQITNVTGTGVSFEGSLDNVNWNTLGLTKTNDRTIVTSASTLSSFYLQDVNVKYFRVRSILAGNTMTLFYKIN